MRKIWRIIISVAVAIIAFVLIVTLLTPWMDRWGATDAEIAAAYPGDELVTDPASFVNRAVTINAAPEEIYPWIVQLGADKGGMYSYDWFESNILQCRQTNADRIHDEWQNLQIGDEMKMCPEGSGPPPYIIALIVPNKAIVMGHQENGKWVDLWQFIIIPQVDGKSRLITRTRTMMVGGFWDLIHPGVFVMERGMLLGIKARAEKMSGQ